MLNESILVRKLHIAKLYGAQILQEMDKFAVQILLKAIVEYWVLFGGILVKR